jgi:hypothetical protein
LLPVDVYSRFPESPTSLLFYNDEKSVRPKAAFFSIFTPERDSDSADLQPQPGSLDDLRGIYPNAAGGGIGQGHLFGLVRWMEMKGPTCIPASL